MQSNYDKAKASAPYPDYDDECPLCMSPLKKRRPSSSTFLGSVDSGAAAAQSCGSSFEGVFSRYTVTTHCDHRFHLDCLQSTRSFEMSNCPMCREEVPPGITPAKKSAIAGSRPLYGGVNVLPSAANSASSPVLAPRRRPQRRGGAWRRRWQCWPWRPRGSPASGNSRTRPSRRGTSCRRGWGGARARGGSRCSRQGTGSKLSTAAEQGKGCWGTTMRRRR